MRAPAICTLATESCFNDLKTFLFTVQLYNNPCPKIYLLFDKFIEDKVELYDFVTAIPELEKYGTVDRQTMERTVGTTYKTKWEDFMMEKATIMEKAFDKKETSVFFTDCDICFMGPLPKIPEESKCSLALSPHLIRPMDEKRFGRFNAGFLWTSNPEVPGLWRKAAFTSRYYDQAALEEVATKMETYIFPKQTNYGWWRMYQGSESYDALQKEWSVFRGDAQNHSGIKVNNDHLLSVHTHWHEKKDPLTTHFNKFVISKLQILEKGKHKNAQLFLNFLTNDLKIDM